MNPTHKQDNNGPEQPTRLRDIAAKFVDSVFFHSRITAMSDMAAQPVVDACQICGRPGCYPVCEISANGVQNCGPAPDGPAGDGGFVLTDAGRQALDEASADGGCLSCGAAGGFPYCQRSYNGRWSCADLAGMDESDRRGENLDPAERDAPDVGAVPGSPAQILPLAARYLERHGWIQGAYYDPTATVFTPAADLVGAIGMVCYGGPVEAPAQHFDDPGFLDFEQAVLHLDRYLLVEDGSEAYEFNDAKGRRVEDVIRVLRDAAARPAEELIDALRALSARDDRVTDRVKLLTPQGIWADSGLRDATCGRCVNGCSTNNYHGYADPGAFDYCGCTCHSTTPVGGDA